MSHLTGPSTALASSLSVPQSGRLDKCCAIMYACIDMNKKTASAKMVSLATRVEESVLARLKDIAEQEYCSISVVLRKAIERLGEAYQKSSLPEHLMERIPTPKHPVGITIRVSPLQARRVKTLAADEGCSVSDLLRAAIHHFFILYQEPVFTASMTEFFHMPSSRVRMTMELDEEVVGRLKDIALEREESLQLVLGDALQLYVAFHDKGAFAEFIRNTRAFLTYLTIVLPLPKETSGKTLEEALREYMGMPRGETDQSGSSQIRGSKQGGGNGKKKPKEK